uniref:HMG box domain-containing protein n=1 Tax=Panagrellus redivivus TaxID=6233 RepID=A0A7E4UNE4_PANRE
MSTRKRNRVPSASEDEISDSDATGKKTALDLPVFQFRDLVVALEEVCGDELSKLTAGTSIAKLVEKHDKLKPFEELVNNPAFPQQWKALYAAATRPKNLTLADANSYLKRFLGQGETVTFFDGYPANPRRAIDYYVAAKRKPNMTVLESAQIRKQYKNDPDIEKYKKQGEADRVRFVGELKAFLEANESRLTDEQKKYIDHRIKVIEPVVKSPGPKKEKKEKKPKKTALEWFAEVNAAEFSKYEGEKREKRILKKFSKLSEAELIIYEKLANK